MCLLLVEGLHFACVEHAQCPLLAHRVNTHTHTHTHTHTLSSICNFSTKSVPEFSYTLYRKGWTNHQYLNGQQLAGEVRTGMCKVLTKSRLSFMYKMIREIISMPRADSHYPNNFMVNSWVFKDEESESDAKTKNRHGVRSWYVM